MAFNGLRKLLLILFIGYGAVYFAQNWCLDNGLSITGARCLVSGSGNVAQYTVEKILELGGIPLTLSDSTGFILEPNGFTKEQLAKVMLLKNVKRGRISEYCRVSLMSMHRSNKVWK